jgi:hypothetical protein
MHLSAPENSFPHALMEKGNGKRAETKLETGRKRSRFFSVYWETEGKAKWETKTPSNRFRGDPWQVDALRGKMYGTAVRFLWIILLSALLTGCKEPKAMIIPLDKSKWDKELRPAMERLADEDRISLKKYLARLGRGSDRDNRVPPGTTIAEAIFEQRDFERQQIEQEQRSREFFRAIEAAAENERIEKENDRTRELAEKERAAQEYSEKMREFSNQAPKLRVYIVQKTANLFRGENPFEAELTVRISNPDRREIRALKGVLIFKDAVGDPIFQTGITLGSIPTQRDIEHTLKFPLTSQDRRRGMPQRLKESDVRAEIEPQVVHFSDGSEIKRPDNPQ